MRRVRERFPEAIGSVDELPAPIADGILQSQPAGSIREIIRIPPGSYPMRRTIWGFELPFGWRQTPERILVFGEHAVTVMEIEQATITATTSVPLGALIDIHLFQELLYSWIELVWAGQDGVNAIKTEYNAVGGSLIWQGLTYIRESFPQHSVHEPDSPPDIDLSGFPFKFQSFLRSSLMLGERLVVAIYQPAIPPRSRRWRRLISPNRVVAVTDRNIIVIEDQRNRFLRRDRAAADYSIVRHFYPLGRLRQVAVEPGPDADLLRLRFGADAAIHDATLPFEPLRAQQLHDALRACSLASSAST